MVEEPASANAMTDGLGPRPDDEDRAAREEWFWSAAEYTGAILVERNGLRTFVVPGDPYISKQTFLDGHFDEDRMAVAIAAATRHIGRDPVAGRTIVDVGANIGTTTLFALHRFGAVEAIAIEPHPDNLRLLRANLAVNDLSARVRIIEMAVSDTEGVARLDVATQNRGDHRLVAPGDEARPPDDDHPGTFIEVRSTRLDELVPRGLDIGLLWIDTQGHDARVLAGAARVSDAADACMVEYWPYGIERTSTVDDFEEVVSRRWPLFMDIEDLLKGDQQARSTADLRSLRTKYPPDGSHTELLLLRGAGATPQLSFADRSLIWLRRRYRRLAPSRSSVRRGIDTER